MVSWTNMFPADPVGGWLTGYGRFPAMDNPSVPESDKPWAMNSTASYMLATPGTVDANIPTRGQIAFGDGGPNFSAMTSLLYTQADVDAHPGRFLTSSMFIAPASAFGPGVIPTPDQIRGAATTIRRRTTGRTTPGTVVGSFPAVLGLPPLPVNTKYWLMVAPTHVSSMSDPVSVANDVPVGDVNVNGRAVSMWSNRTPLAPVITSPSLGLTVQAGTEIDFAFSPRDPDRIAYFPGDGGRTDFDDLAGVQIQYAPQPTDDDPTPTWSDLPIANTAGDTFRRGWYMDKSASVISDDGAKKFWSTYQMKIRCATVNPLAPESAYLPPGDWQIRVRTFDYGHPFPDGSGLNPWVPFVPEYGTQGLPPLADATRSYTPDNYPAGNTSPWSAPVTISIPAQVPSPIPLTPVNNIAVIEDAPVTLVWQYRNTYTPAYAQAARTVQIRRVGETVWTTLVSEDPSSSSSLVVTGFDLVSGNQYEWRAQATDASGVTSDYSASAFFWIVPAPGSGEVIIPGETVEGATLGCGTHRIEVYRRGGKVRVGEIQNVSFLEWGRVRDDISTARIVVSGWGVDCGNLLAKLQTWAYEVVIFRDNGYSVDRVWEGPITLLTYERDSVIIQAKDVLAYAYRRIIRQAMSDTGSAVTAGSSVVDRAVRVLLNAFAPDDPNVLGYLQSMMQPDDAKQYRSTPAYSRTAFEEVDDMAANAGLDYTAVGRAILVWGTKHRIGTLPEFRDEDLGSSPIVSEYGMSMSNVYVVSDGNGTYGGAHRLNEDGEDPSYGLVEMLSSTWASDSTEETGTYTEAGIATVRESFASAAERSIADRYPPPMVVRVPDNTRLNPDTVISIQHLVPGVVVPLRSTGTLRTVVATQKLDSVKVTEQNGEESITITLSPFSRDDVAAEGEGA